MAYVIYAEFIRWIEAFLRHRSFRVAETGFESDASVVRSGFPQGYAPGRYSSLFRFMACTTFFGKTSAAFASDVVFIPKNN